MSEKCFHDSMNGYKILHSIYRHEKEEHMRMYSRLVLVIVFAFLAMCEVAAAKGARSNLMVSPYFTSHMVLQRDMPVPVWGTASPGATINIKFHNENLFDNLFQANAGPDGKWMVRLPIMAAGDTPETMTIDDGKSTIEFTDVLVGDVWILSGQSNMNYLLRDCDGGEDAIATSGNYPDIRLYMTWLSGNGTTGVWLPSNSTNTPYWSGVGFFFARALFDPKIGNPVPIGLIQVAKNGTSIADWTTYNGGRSAGKLYKNNIVPIQPFAIRGVIWYQGETEANPSNYYKMLPGLIQSWRTDWNQGDFPFYIVQLAPISGRDGYSIIRDAQVSALTLSNTAMACIVDIPTLPITDIHPSNKEPVGERLALAARHFLYGEAGLNYSGPIRTGASINEYGEVVVTFAHTDGGLVTDDDYAPGPFTIAGNDGVFYPATAALIDGPTVVLSSLDFHGG
jgi:sialate O-acetylesterase